MTGRPGLNLEILDSLQSSALTGRGPDRGFPEVLGLLFLLLLCPPHVGGPLNPYVCVVSPPSTTAAP